MLPFVLAIVLATALAWWSWHRRLNEGLARGAALARATGMAALLLLLFDPGVGARTGNRRPIVLLDNSVSMHASGGRAAEAARDAASLGDTTSFGELAPGEPGGRSDLFDALSGAATSGRPIVIVTDGEISDAATIPADLLAQATVQLLPRTRRADIAITDVQAPLRLAAGDTLGVDVEATRTPDAADSASIVVRDSATTLLRGVVHFGGRARGRIHLDGVLPRALRGERWLEIARVGAPDGEPDDDLRWWRLVIAPTPGIVVLAESPDWDGRALYRTLKDVAEVPIRGYVQLQRGHWRRMDDLREVAATDVTVAARAADLLAVRGDIAAWRTFGASRLLWPGATSAGDWYLAGSGLSPVSGAFTGIDLDSLPPAVAIHPIAGDSSPGWVGATARLSRRGTPVPVVAGREDRTGRTITIAADGFYRWALRGGVADQAWRTMMAEATSWLLATPEGDSLSAKPVDPVTQRGKPVEFRWTGSGAPAAVPITLHGPHGDRADTLRFDASGRAILAAGVGRYRYEVNGRAHGSFAVEPYADEVVPSPLTLVAHAASGKGSAPRRPVREVAWLFALAIIGFGAEWMLRRKLGMQ